MSTSARTISAGEYFKWNGGAYSSESDARRIANCPTGNAIVMHRFSSRFLVVIVVALAIEGLVATFKAMHEDTAQLPYAASLLAAVGLLLAGWGVFIRLNRYAEELEPEAMEAAKREDRKLKQ